MQNNEGAIEKEVMKENENKGAYENEIGVYEMVLVLMKRIKLIAGIFIMGVVLGTVVSFIMPNIYRARATLWIDYFLVHLIQSFLKNIQSGNFNDEGKLSLVVPLQQQGKSPDINNLSISILNSLGFKRKVIENFKNDYANKAELVELERAIDAGKGEQLFKAEIDKNTQSILLISEQRSRELAESILRAAIEEFRKELEKVSMTYSGVSMSEGKPEYGNFILYVVEPPNSIKDPVKPQRTLIITASAVSSIFLGIFIAFLVEWWSNRRNTSRAF